MKTKTISVMRVKNLGNYQSERLELMAEIDEGEDVGKAILSLRLYIRSQLERSLDEPKGSEDPGYDPIPF